MELREAEDRGGKNTGVGCQSLLHISCKDGHNKGQKWYGPNRSRRY